MDIVSGIYAIVNKVNGKRYVGSAVNLKKRWQYHKYELRKKLHPSKHLQSAWDKYGESGFDFQVIEYVPNLDNLIPREQFYLDNLSPEYNTLKIAGSVKGLKHTEANKIRMSIIHTGFMHTEESKKKMSEYWSGRPRGEYSDERRKKISESHKGKKINDSQKAALMAYRNRPKTEEIKNKISAAQKGYRPTAETIEKLKQAWIRRKARKNNASG